MNLPDDLRALGCDCVGNWRFRRLDRCRQRQKRDGADDEIERQGHEPVFHGCTPNEPRLRGSDRGNILSSISHHRHIFPSAQRTVSLRFRL